MADFSCPIRERECPQSSSGCPWWVDTVPGEGGCAIRMMVEGPQSYIEQTAYSLTLIAEELRKLREDLAAGRKARAKAKAATVQGDLFERKKGERDA